MKHQDTLTEVITKNINYALDAIPRALGTEKPKRLRKTHSRKTQSKKTKAKSKGKALKGKGVLALKKGATKVKSMVRKMTKKQGKRTSNVHKLPSSKRPVITSMPAA